MGLTAPYTEAMGRAFWLGQLGVIVCLGLGSLWPGMFVVAGVLQAAVVIRAVARAMRELDAADAATEAPEPAD